MELSKCAIILGHLQTINFPFGTNGKLKVLGVPILKHFRENSVVLFWQSISRSFFFQFSSQMELSLYQVLSRAGV